jgi:hypothetical protein
MHSQTPAVPRLHRGTQLPQAAQHSCVQLLHAAVLLLVRCNCARAAASGARTRGQQSCARHG